MKIDIEKATKICEAVLDAEGEAVVEEAAFRELIHPVWTLEALAEIVRLRQEVVRHETAFEAKWVQKYMGSDGKNTWADGVRDAIKIVESRLHTARAIDSNAMRVMPAVFATLDEVLVFLKAMLERGEYHSRMHADG